MPAANMPAARQNLRDLPLWAWLILPPMMISLQFLALGISQGFHNSIFFGELGAVELGTVIMYLPGIAAVILAFRLRDRLPHKLLGLWVLIFIVGCIYIAGEEASWGQHYLHWNTPEHWAALNKQHETNLHNSTTWLNQKPRIAMELWILIGGILMPLRMLLKKFRYRTDDWRYWVWPTPYLLPAALACFLIKLPLHLDHWLHKGAEPLFTGFNLNETHEFNIAVFLTLYLCSILIRLRQMEGRT